MLALMILVLAPLFEHAEHDSESFASDLLLVQAPINQLRFEVRELLAFHSDSLRLCLSQCQTGLAGGGT